MISIRALKHLALAMGIGLATIGATAFAPTDAVAQDTDKISMQFVGFGANPDFYAILQSSKLGGKALVIYQIGGQGPKLVYPLNKTSLEAALQSKEVAVFGINANYVAGMAAPAGYKLGGMEFATEKEKGCRSDSIGEFYPYLSSAIQSSILTC